MKKIRLWFILFVCLSLVIISACGGVRRPGPKQPELREEPTISLFVVETGEKKQIKIEEYIQGVVAAEMDPTWPVEALAAQAIIARTFTMERIASGQGVPQRGTDASTSHEEFQAYDATRINSNVKKAVERTRGEVVKYNNKYIKAWFFADGGGRTAASAEEGLAYKKEPSPYIHSVEDPGSAVTVPENKAWQAEFPLSVVRQKVQEVTGTDPGAIKNVSILEKGPSGRVTSLKVGNATVSGPGLRLALGSGQMRSTLLTGIKLAGGKLIVSGKGFGHGVGMSQWGAKQMADNGKKAEEIIQYFFKDVEIEKEWK